FFYNEKFQHNEKDPSVFCPRKRGQKPPSLKGKELSVRHECNLERNNKTPSPLGKVDRPLARGAGRKGTKAHLPLQGKELNCSEYKILRQREGPFRLLSPKRGTKATFP